MGYVGLSGYGYGAGGGGGVFYGFASCGGGGGFDPNAYYGLPRIVGAPADQSSPIQGVPVSNMDYIINGTIQVGTGKPGVLFLEVTKP